MNRCAVLMIFCSIMSFKLKAQEVFVSGGKITFEKQINMQRATADWDLPDEAKEKMQKYSTSKWEFYFSPTESLYKAKKKETENNGSNLFSFSSETSQNQLYANYPNNSRVIRKNILGDDYLLKDTIPLLSWKIMHDVRTICGYQCRKAIGRIDDTVYVVAFYAEEILLKGGPEGFSGLPGMILGLAIPRYNTTWFATKVEAFANTATEISAPKSGKPTETDKEKKKLLELISRFSGSKTEKPEDLRRRLYSFTL